MEYLWYVIAALTELVSRNGNDTITVPLVTTILLSVLAWLAM